MSNGIGWISRSNHQSSSSAFLRILKIPQAFPTIRNNAETNREASPRRPPQIGKTNHHNCCKQQKTFNLRWVMADNPESKIIPNQNKKNPSRFKWKYKIKKKKSRKPVAWRGWCACAWRPASLHSDVKGKKQKQVGGSESQKRYQRNGKHKTKRNTRAR